MTKLPWFSNPKNRLDPIAGGCDGILTALTLAGGKMLDSKSPVDVTLAFRVASATALSGAFAFFVAHYAQLRGELFEAERQLNLTSHGRLASSRLGRKILSESVSRALVGSACSFGGAILPLGVSASAPSIAWLAIAVALTALGVLGLLLALAERGRPIRWAGGLMLGGGALAYIGARLHLI